MTQPDPIYLNACSRSLPAPDTVRVMADYLAQEASSGELAATAAHQADLHAARAQAAAVLGGRAEETGFGSSTSAVWGQLVANLPKGRDGLGQNGLGRGRILISDYEWGYNVRLLQRLVQGTGLTLQVVSSYPDGQFDLDAWQAQVAEDVVAVSLPLVTSLCGIVFPVQQILALDWPAQALLLVDAAQGLGRVDLARPLARADVVVATTRKWARGPRQTAVFRVSAKAQAALGLGLAEIEPPDVNTALRLGVGHALGDLAAAGPGPAMARIRQLDQHAQAGLAAAGHRVLTIGERAPGTLCVPIPQDRRADVTQRLDQAGIIAKWLTPKVEEPLAPYPPGQALLRLSPHVYNTAAQIDRALSALGPADRP